MEIESIVVLFAFALIGVLIVSKDVQTIQTASTYLGVIIGAGIAIYSRDR